MPKVFFFSFSLKPNNFTRLYLGVGHSGSSFSDTLYAFPICSFNSFVFYSRNVRGSTLKPPTLARHHSNYLHEFFTTGGPGKEQGTNKPPPTRRVWERSKGDTTCPTTSQNPSLWHPSWLNKVCTTRKDSESEWLTKDNPETNPITIKRETASHVAELFSWVPLPYCSPFGCPFPIKSLALSAHVSPQTVHFLVLDKSPEQKCYLE